MAYPKILQRLFEDFGAGPKLRGDILPFGSKEGTACEGDDARLSNARVPETHNETHKTGGTDPLTPADIGAHPADGMASTDKAGIVRLSSAIDMDSEDQASTPKAVKAAYELADTAKSMAAEAQGKADAAYEKATLDATTDVAGRTQLSNEIDSDREDMAATPRAVKSVHDKALALAASAESTATAAKTNADKVPGISTQIKALEEKVQTATPDKIGLVRIGQGISVDETGLISTEPVTLATPDAPGIVQVGAGLEVTLPTKAAEGEEAPTPGILSLGAHASEAPDAYGTGSLFRRTCDLKTFENPEWEAWEYARQFLMPEKVFRRCLAENYTSADLVARFDVNPRFVENWKRILQQRDARRYHKING